MYIVSLKYGRFHKASAQSAQDTLTHCGHTARVQTEDATPLSRGGDGVAAFGGAPPPIVYVEGEQGIGEVELTLRNGDAEVIMTYVDAAVLMTYADS